MNDAGQPEIGYILKGYPRLSETFILNEIYLLEQMGLRLHIFSVKRPFEPKSHAVVNQIKAPITYLPEVTSVTDSPFADWLRVNLPHFRGDHWQLCYRRPRAYIQTLATTFYLSLKYRSSLWPRFKKVFFKDFLRAGAIALAVLENGRIHHLHGHFCHGSTTMTMFVSQLTGIPYSFTAHAKDIYLEKLNPGDLLSRKIAGAEFVVTCTNANRHHLESHNRDGTPIHTIYHGLDTSLFTPVPDGNAGSSPLILAVGRFVEKKGFPTLVQACHLLRQRQIAFRCLIVGGEEEQSPVVEQLIQELDLADHVAIHDAVRQTRLRQFYRDCTLLALPCQVVDNGDRDGIPNVLVEAMAMEIPVVSTNISGIPELIDHNQNGLLVPPKDAETLADALERLLTDAALRRRLGQAARIKVMRTFDSQQTTRTLLALFRRVLSQDGCETAVSPPPAPDSIFQPPFDTHTPAQLLHHFRRRRIAYFPVLDADHTAPPKIAGVLDNAFDFNHERHQLPPDFDWTANPSQDTEWLIYLHKFYYAVGLGRAYNQTADPRYAHKWVELVERWIDTVPLDFLSSDVTGRRVQNWIFAHYYFVSQTADAPILSPFYQKFLRSLHAQVEYLRHNLTPARNHRTIELYAIFLTAVVFPEFKQSAEWLDFARRELHKNLQTDLLPDGAQYELSTDYHHIVLKNYLGVRQLAQLNGIDMPPEMDALLNKALDFALYVHKPDGNIPSLSDGDSRSFLHLLRQGHALYNRPDLLYAASEGRQGQPPARSRLFPSSGYAILRSGWGEGTEPYEDERYLVFDCGPLGAGNHGHLDLLSFEMAAYGRSLIVDPGRYTYDESGEMNWRALFRGTSYHNTVQIDKKEQTHYGFHKDRFRILGPEPVHELKAFVTQPGFDYLHGIARSHEYPVVHERKLFFPWLEYWIITDVLGAAEPHQYDLWFHLAPEAWQQVTVEKNNDTCQVSAPGLVIAQPDEAEIQLVVEKGYVSPSYGIKVAAPILRFAREATNSIYHTILYPYRTEKPDIDVTVLPVQHNGRLCPLTQAFALSITIRQAGQSYKDIYFNGVMAGETAPYRFANFTYDGSLVCIRQDSNDRILNIQGQPGIVQVDGQPGMVKL